MLNREAIKKLQAAGKRAAEDVILKKAAEDPVSHDVYRLMLEEGVDPEEILEMMGAISASVRRNQEQRRASGLDTMITTSPLPGGGLVEVWTGFDFDATARVQLPPKRQETEEKTEEKPYAIHIPGCIAHFLMAEASNQGSIVSTANAIIGSWSTAVLEFYNTASFRMASVEQDMVTFPGLQGIFDPIPFGFVTLQGTAQAKSGGLSTRGLLPSSGSYSLSLLVRIPEPARFPYYCEDNGIASPFSQPDAPVPMRPWMLEAQTGGAGNFTWKTRRPGGFCPVFGLSQPVFSRTINIVAGWDEESGDPITGQPLWPIEAPLEGEPDIVAHENCHFQHGTMTGYQSHGLFLQGDTLCANKRNHYEDHWDNVPVWGPRMTPGRTYHAVVSFDAASGGMALLVSTKSKDDFIEQTLSQEPQREVALSNWGGESNAFWGADSFNAMIGINKVSFTRFTMPWDRSGWPPPDVSDTFETYTFPPTEWGYPTNQSWTIYQSGAMELGNMRIYHRALTLPEMKALAQESLAGQFIADDQDLEFLASKGMEVRQL